MSMSLDAREPNVAVLGLGFVGLATALCLAEKGCAVQGFDTDAERRESLALGRTPFHEPGIPEALAGHLGKNFIVAGSPEAALAAAEFVFICVGTPSGADGTADLSMLLAAAELAAEKVDPARYPVIVIKSTVPPGSTAGAVRRAVEKTGRKVGADLGLAVAPEFLREGKAWADSSRPDRVVVGVVDDRSGEKLRGLYSRFGAPVHVTTANTAEFVKYMSNTLLATLISFANEQAMLARKIGDIEIARAFRILHEDRRWFGTPAGMTSYAFPGCGFGGYCLPKDTAALLAAAKENGLPAELLSAVLAVNHRAGTDAAERIARAVGGDTGAAIGILGLSFKPESDDVRDSPAARIIGELLERGFQRILAHDPMAMKAYAQIFGHPVRYCDTARQLLEESGTVAILTAWPEYRDLDYAGKHVLDCRYCLPDGSSVAGEQK